MSVELRISVDETELQVIKKRVEEKGIKIIELLEGITYSQWKVIAQQVDMTYLRNIKKVNLNPDDIKQIQSNYKKNPKG